MASTGTAEQKVTRHNDDHLRILQAIYGILISFGLRELIEALLPDASSWTFRSFGYLSFLKILIGVAILSLALRFFFIIEEISTYLLYCRENNFPFSSRVLTLFHYPLVIFQACLFYALCTSFKKASVPTFSMIDIKLVIWLQAILLWTNAGWLLRLLWVRKKSDLRSTYELRWIILNTGSAIVAAWICGFPASSVPLTLARSFVIYGVFVVNSGLDLAVTAKFYVPKQ
jgi:hypothetical protein